jgi:hypothetical protein
MPGLRSRPTWYDQLFHWLLLETPTIIYVISTSVSVRVKRMQIPSMNQVGE